MQPFSNFTLFHFCLDKNSFWQPRQLYHTWHRAHQMLASRNSVAAAFSALRTVSPNHRRAAVPQRLPPFSQKNISDDLYYTIHFSNLSPTGTNFYKRTPPLTVAPPPSALWRHRHLDMTQNITTAAHHRNLHPAHTSILHRDDLSAPLPLSVFGSRLCPDLIHSQQPTKFARLQRLIIFTIFYPQRFTKIPHSL